MPCLSVLATELPSTLQKTLIATAERLFHGTGKVRVDVLFPLLHDSPYGHKKGGDETPGGGRCAACPGGGGTPTNSLPSSPATERAAPTGRVRLEVQEVSEKVSSPEGHRLLHHTGPDNEGSGARTTCEAAILSSFGRPVRSVSVTWSSTLLVAVT